MLLLRIGYDPNLDEAEDEPLYFLWNGTKWVPENEGGVESLNNSANYVTFEGGKTYELK